MLVDNICKRENNVEKYNQNQQGKQMLCYAFFLLIVYFLFTII